MSFIIQTEDQSRSQGEANKQFLDLERKVSSSYAKYIPSTKRQHAEWKHLRAGLLSTATSRSGYYFGVTLFCRDDEEEAAKEAERTKKAFAMQGLNMVRADLMQMRKNQNHLFWMITLCIFVGEFIINGISIYIAHRLNTDDIMTIMTRNAGIIGLASIILSVIKVNDVNLYSSSLG